MTEFYSFASNSPFLTFFLAVIVGEVLIYPLKLIKRWIRHRDIVARGWPTVPLMDADGDIVHPKAD